MGQIVNFLVTLVTSILTKDNIKMLFVVPVYNQKENTHANQTVDYLYRQEHGGNGLVEFVVVNCCFLLRFIFVFELSFKVT